MLHIPKRLEGASLSTMVAQVEENYTLQKGDILTLDVFANKGEIAIDPNFELLKTLKRDVYMDLREREYMVRGDGTVKFPLVRAFKVAGKRISDVETALELLYGRYYNEPYVLLRCVSRRVVVLGAVGGQIIPLPNEEITLLEVLARAGGLYDKGRARYVLLLRGDLHHPTVYRVDLSTLHGMRQSIVPIQPNDILYIMPYRRRFNESVGYVSVLAQSMTAFLALFLWLHNL